MTIHGTIARARQQRHALIAAGRPAQIEKGSVESPATLTDFAAEFLRTRAAVLSPRTIAIYRDDYRFRIAPRLGAMPLEQITRRRCEVFVAELVGEEPSYRMLTGTVTTLRAILGKAVEWELIPSNPAARLSLPPRPPNDGDEARRVLTEGQLVTLIDEGSDKPRVQTMLRAAAEAGLRRGEICGLRWSDVDLAKGQIRVRYSYDGPTKGRRARTVSITPNFATALEDWYVESVIGGGGTGGFVWPGASGAIMQEHSPTQMCARALVRAGLVDEDGKPLVTLHGLRHTCASIMLGRGVPLIVVSRHLGHADVNITARVYAHLTDEGQLGAAAQAFQAVFEESRPGCSVGP